MPIKQFKPTSPGRRTRVRTRSARSRRRGPKKPSPNRSRASRAAATTRAASPSATAVAAPAVSTASSTSSGTSSACPAKVVAIEYDPNRTARIALLHYADGEKRYILAPVGLAVGAVMQRSPGRGARGQLAAAAQHADGHAGPQHRTARPAAAARWSAAPALRAQLMAKEGDYALLRLPSGEMRRVRIDCIATVGQVGNVEHTS